MTIKTYRNDLRGLYRTRAVDDLVAHGAAAGSDPSSQALGSYPFGLIFTCSTMGTRQESRGTMRLSSGAQEIDSRVVAANGMSVGHGTAEADSPEVVVADSKQEMTGTNWCWSFSFSFSLD